jgi:hypothetical protein
MKCSSYRRWLVGELIEAIIEFLKNQGGKPCTKVDTQGRFYVLI